MGGGGLGVARQQLGGHAVSWESRLRCAVSAKRDVPHHMGRKLRLSRRVGRERGRDGASGTSAVLARSLASYAKRASKLLGIVSGTAEDETTDLV